MRINAGNIGSIAIGPNAQSVGQGGSIVNAQRTVSTELLATEFTKLREALIREARSPEHYAAIGRISSAEIAVKVSDGCNVGAALSPIGAAGKWVYEIAKNIGANLAADIIQRQLGL